MRHLSVALPALAIVALAGCATSGPLTPTTPATPQDFAGSTVMVGDMATSALGALDIAIDPDTLEFTATPVAPRAAAGQGDNFQLSIRPFLAPKHLKLIGITRNPAGNLELTVRLTHPFAAPADLVGPPTGTKRVDLHVFDVNGILVADGTDAFYNGAVLTNGNLLANADGYRDPGILFDKSAFGIPVSGANVFPYRVFANGLDTTSDRNNQGNYDPADNGWQSTEFLAPTGFDVFAQGTSADVIYELIPPGSGSLDFALVVTAKYQDPRSAGAGRTKRLPTANPLDLRYILPEASGDLQRISATVSGTLRDDRDTDLAQIDVQILDWDHDATVATAFPNNADLAESREDSAIGGVEMDFPTLNSALPVSGSTVAGVPANPMLWASTANVNNADLFDAGLGGEEVLGLVRVLDNQDLDDGSPTGIKPFILNESSTAPVSGATLSSTRYQIVRVLVEDFNGGGPLNDEAPAAATFSFPASVTVNTPFDLDLDTAVPGLATLDPDGLSLFEVDWDNNGTWDQNIATTSGSPAADFTNTYTVVNAAQQYKLRITDNYSPAIDRLSTEYGPFTVNVQAGGGPVTPTVNPPGPANPGQLGSTISFQYDRFIRAMTADTSGNVYIVYRYGGTIPYSVVRSNNGGTTFGTPVDVTGLISSKGANIDLLANNDVVIGGIQGTGSTTPGDMYFMRLVPSGTNSLTPGTLHTVSPALEWRDATIATDPADATKAWIVANRDTTSSGESDDTITVYSVTNATTAPTFTQVGLIDPASHNGNIFDPSVTIDSTSQLHIIWTKANTVLDASNGLWYRRFNTATNTVNGAEERVSLASHQGVGIHGHIELDLSGVPVVAYDEGNGILATNDIYVAKRGGGVWSTAVSITGGADPGQQNPQMARDATGRFVVVWRDNRTGSADANVYGRVLNADLSPASSEFVIDNTTQDTLHPHIGWAGSGNNFVTGWYDITSGVTTERLIKRTFSY